MGNMTNTIKPSNDEEHASPISPEEYLSKLFIKYDSDNNGRISKFEFVSILRTLARIAGTSFPNETDLEDIFNYLDVDGDKTINFK
jgi:Ca2+-binding EF-hand superfamily protein